MEAKLSDVYLSLYVLNWLEKNRDKAEKRFRALPKLENVSVKPLDPEENTLMSFMLFLISKSFPV